MVMAAAYHSLSHNPRGRLSQLAHRRHHHNPECSTLGLVVVVIAREVGGEGAEIVWLVGVGQGGEEVEVVVAVSEDSLSVAAVLEGVVVVVLGDHRLEGVRGEGVAVVLVAHRFLEVGVGEEGEAVRNQLLCAVVEWMQDFLLLKKTDLTKADNFMYAPNHRMMGEDVAFSYGLTKDQRVEALGEEEVETEAEEGDPIAGKLQQTSANNVKTCIRYLVIPYFVL